MVNGILSPCLYISNGEITNLGQLIEVLDFISSYLDIRLDSIDSSILSEENWYAFPKYKPTIYNQFTILVVPLLKKLVNRSNKIHLDKSNIEYNIFNNEFVITDYDEFNIIAQYISITKEEMLLFVGHKNENIEKLLEISINDKSYKIPIIKNVWYDDTGNYNNHIKKDVKNYNSVFPCQILCSKIGKEILETGNKSLYKKYAKIIAERNCYIKLQYDSRQYKNVPYYIRNDKEYILCVDTLHGTFEVFKKTGSTYDDYRGEYDFSCNKIIGKTSSSENHICYKK